MAGKSLVQHVRDAIHEVADAAINPEGYADDSEESDRRAERRDRLESTITDAVERADPSIGCGCSNCSC